MWIEQYIIEGVRTVVHDKQYMYNFSMCDKNFGHTGLQPDSYYKPTTIYLTASQAENELLWLTVLYFVNLGLNIKHTATVRAG